MTDLTESVPGTANVSLADWARGGFRHRSQRRSQRDRHRIEERCLAGRVLADEERESFVEDERAVLEAPKIPNAELIDMHGTSVDHQARRGPRSADSRVGTRITTPPNVCHGRGCHQLPSRSVRIHTRQRRARRLQLRDDVLGEDRSLLHRVGHRVEHDHVQLLGVDLAQSLDTFFLAAPKSPPSRPARRCRSSGGTIP